jgi:hypothetical protein
LILECIENGDIEGVVALLSSLKEAQRRVLAPEVSGLGRRLLQDYVAGSHSRWRAAECASLTILGTATLTEIRGLPQLILEPQAGFRVLAARRPAWLAAWCEWVTASGPAHWRCVRPLVREGLVPKPRSDLYVLGMLQATFRHDPYAFLLSDPDLLNDELWTLFRLEGTAELCLASADKFALPDHRWDAALLRLCTEGRIPRARLLDASLDALSRDFPAFRAAWFSRFHERLSPTLDEVSARTSQYVRLLGSRIPSTVSLAAKVVSRLQKASLVPAEALLDAIEPVLFAKGKGTVVLALRMLSATGDPRAAELAAPALEHPDREVREMARSLRERFGIFHQTVPEPAKSAGVSGAPQPQVAPLQPTPVADVEELVLLLGHLFETGRPAIEIERAMDGLSRLHLQRPAGFAPLTAPLRSRVRKRQFVADLSMQLVRMLIMAWLDREPPPERPPTDDLATLGYMHSYRFIIDRVEDLARRIAAGEPARALLAMPTNVEGWVHPVSFVQRLHDAPAPVEHDLVQGVLRLAADRRAEAIALCEALPDGSCREAILFALGAPVAPPAGPPLLTLAAAQDREPAPCTYTFEWHRENPWIPPLLPPHWLRMTWPGHLDRFLLQGCLAIASNLDWSSAIWSNREYLESLLDTAVPMDGAGATLLTLGLAARHPAEGATACDGLIAAIADGRMTAETLGQALIGLGMGRGRVQSKRVAQRLSDAARASHAHAAVIRGALERLFATPPPEKRASRRPLAELALDLGADPLPWLD